ncbi:MAG: PDZ domain-containing protein [Planctomycetes bacterium]|nr:PDZ domain-containing protein [Planctomycetota bacterium]
MRTTMAIFALLFSIQCAITAQDDAPEVKKVDTNALLSSALTGDKDARTELLKLSIEDLQAAIKGFAFKATTKSSTIQMKTKCPDGYTRPYWVRIPKGYDPAKSYPAIVGLHGGVSGAPLYGTEERPAPGKSAISFWEANLGEQVDSVFLIGCSAGPRETGRNAVWWKPQGRANIERFIFETKRQFNIDDDKVFVTGHSDGGSGSFALAAQTPNTYAGYFSMNGHPLVQASDDQGFWLENFKGKNIYAFNSGKDSLYPAKSMTPIYDQANKAGADIKYSVHPDNNHGIRDVIGEEIPKFMKEYFANWKRNLVPTDIDWTCGDLKSGRCGWLEITEIAELKYNNAGENANVTIEPGRVRLGITVKRDVDQPTVESVVAESTAAKMGMKADDEIIEFNGTKITSMAELVAALGKCKAGDKVTVKVKHSDKEKDLEGKFAAGGDNTLKVKRDAARVKGQLVEGGVGVSLRNVGKIRIHVTPKMLEDGSLTLMYYPAKNSFKSQPHRVSASKEYILDSFLETADRKNPFINSIEIDFSDLKKPAPADDEDEF